MAKKSGSSPLLIMAAIIIGTIASVPKDVWVFLFIIGGVVLVAWLAKNLFGGKAKATAEPPTAQAGTAHRASAPARATGSLKTARGEPDDEFANFRLDDATNSDGYRVPASPVASSGLRWVPAGEKVNVAGFDVPGGMLYIGSNPHDDYGHTEPSAINPKLRVTGSPVDWSDRLTDYWPSYSSISPDARRAYLQWLVDGRRAPDANIGYVFLYFYGLERRVLVDLGSGTSERGEVEVIRNEVRRLLRIYGDNNSFRRYASHFLAFIEADNYRSQPFAPDPPTVNSALEQGYELPLSLKLGLGHLAVAQKPVPASWALAWALNDPNIYRRTPVSRCEAEFKALFNRKYAEDFGDGFVLRLNKTKLQVTYQPASGALGRQEMRRNVGDLPDVTAVKGPIQKLQALVDACTKSLESYSRFIGRNPDKAHALEGLLQLPVELWPAPVRAELDDLKSRVGDGMLLMAFGELSGRLKSAGALSRDKVIGLARALESLHIGLEPDVLAGSRTPKAEDKVALFATLPEDSTARAGHAYRAAAVTLDLACMAVHADGEASAHELMSLTKQINAWAHLSDTQRKRLKAHLRLGIDQPATLASLKKKLEPLAEDARRSICRLLAHLMQADGVVSPAEVKFLERTYKALALDTKLVYSDLHASPAPNVVPTTSTTQATPVVTAIGGTAGFALDPARIAQLETETAEVSELLAKVFVDEEQQESAPLMESVPEEEPAAAPGILGLDADHSAFVRILVSRTSWLRGELADAASDMELMLDGALEHINEAVLDALDAPLTEGDDPIEINKEVLEALPV
ncbi:TerB N-terminal domain-containing protein [Thauera sp. ZXT1-4]|uniref:TerB N-terminal domain-containing protein n=1 Tax=Thauera sp. ZXT1-4 TaxID=3460294 RepID=UPI0040407439